MDHLCWLECLHIKAVAPTSKWIGVAAVLRSTATTAHADRCWPCVEVRVIARCGHWRIHSSQCSNALMRCIPCTEYIDHIYTTAPVLPDCPTRTQIHTHLSSIKPNSRT